MTGRSSAKRTSLCLLALLFCLSGDNLLLVVGEPEPIPSELLYSESFINNAENLVSILISFFILRFSRQDDSREIPVARFSDTVEQAEAGDRGEERHGGEGESVGRRADGDTNCAGGKDETEDEKRRLHRGTSDAQRGYQSAFRQTYRDQL